jgi:hypothetical protein
MVGTAQRVGGVEGAMDAVSMALGKFKVRLAQLVVECRRAGLQREEAPNVVKGDEEATPQEEPVADGAAAFGTGEEPKERAYGQLSRDGLTGREASVFGAVRELESAVAELRRLTAWDRAAELERAAVEVVARVEGAAHDAVGDEADDVEVLIARAYALSRRLNQAVQLLKQKSV